MDRAAACNASDPGLIPPRPRCFFILLPLWLRSWEKSIGPRHYEMVLKGIQSRMKKLILAASTMGKLSVSARQGNKKELKATQRIMA